MVIIFFTSAIAVQLYENQSNTFIHLNLFLRLTTNRDTVNKLFGFIPISILKYNFEKYM